MLWRAGGLAANEQFGLRKERSDTDLVVVAVGQTSRHVAYRRVVVPRGSAVRATVVLTL